MRGASRTSLTAAKDRLATMAAGSARPSQLGAELFAVVGLLDSEAERACRRPPVPHSCLR